MSVYPKLVLEQFAKTEIRIIAESDNYDEDGAPTSTVDATFKCNFQPSIKRVVDKEHNVIERVSIAYLDGDKLGAAADGVAYINGKKYNVSKIVKGLNPDGTVNFTEVELI